MMLEHKFSEIELNTVLDEALKSEPDFTLPENFAADLIVQLNKQISVRQYIFEFLLYLAVFVFLAGATFASFLWLNSDILQSIKLFVSEHLTLLIGINLLLIFTLFADRVLLPYFHLIFTRSKAGIID
jgi:polyferredoxin